MSKFASIRSSYRFIKMAAAAAQYYIRFRICWYRCLQKVKVYQQTKFRRHIPIDGWDITTCFWKTNVRHIGNLLSVSISTICPKSAHYSASGYRISSKSKHPLPKYDVISIAQDGRRPQRLNTTSGFVSVDVTAFRMSKSISKPNYLEISQMKAEIFFMEIQNGLGRGQICFQDKKHVSISWDALLHFLNTKMYFWCL